MNVKHALAWLLCGCTSLVLAFQAQAQSVSCSGVSEWNPATIYAAGAKLTYQGKLYQTTTQIWNVSPTYCTSCGWYQELGTCGTTGGNQPPTVALTAPAAGSTFNAGATITLSANASDSDGSVSKVEFFRGTTSLGSDTSAPYSVSWSGAAAGSYALSAKATDNAGATTTSSTVNITVNAATTDTTAPSVPSGLAATSQTSASITLTWSASTDNSGGSGVAGYSVYRNGTLVGSPATPSFTDSALQADTAYTPIPCVRATTPATPRRPAHRSARDQHRSQWRQQARDRLLHPVGHLRPQLPGEGHRSQRFGGYLTHINYAFGNVRNNRCEVGVIQSSPTKRPVKAVMHSPTTASRSAPAKAWMASAIPGTNRCAATGTSSRSSRPSIPARRC